MSGRPVQRELRIRLALLAVLLISPLLVLNISGPAGDFVNRVWLSLLICLIPPIAALVCFLRAQVSPVDHTAWRLFGCGVTMWAIGVFCHVSDSVGGDIRGGPAWYDIFYFAMYPCFFGGLILILRNRLRSFRHLAYFDVIAGALLLVAVVFTLLRGGASDLAGDSSLDKAILLVYPIADLALLTVLATFFRFTGNRFEGPWPLLAAGLVLFVIADLAFARASPVSDQMFAILMSLWLFGFVFMIGAAWREDGDVREVEPGIGQLLIPVAYFLIGLLVLAYGQNRDLWDAALIVLALSMALTVVRMATTTREYAGVLAEQANRLRDDVTGLPSRRGFDQWLAEIVQDPQNVRTRLMVLSVGLAHADEIRSALGPAAGDTILSAASTRLRRAVSQWGRLASVDRAEFALLCSQGAAPSPAEISAHIAESFSRPITVEGIRVQVKPLVGVSLYPEDTTDPERMLQVASLRRSGADSGLALDPIDPESGIRDLKLVDELRMGIERAELRLEFQPKVSTHDGSVSAVEALVRWQHPRFGLMRPVEFVDLAEEHGLLPDLTDAVVQMAIDEIGVWKNESLDLNVAINIGMANVLDDSLRERILSRTRRGDVSPRQLTLEVSERIVTGTSRTVQSNLDNLADAGFRLSLDDFGSGTTSLGHLRSLPLDEVKVDRSLVMRMHENEREAVVAEGVIAIARDLGLHVVVEGAEAEPTIKRLIELDCGEIQSFYFARPMPGKALPGWLAGFKPTPWR